MTDIVARLRDQEEFGLLGVPGDHRCVSWGEAADEIERLRAALEDLIVAVDYETPPIATGHEVRYRARVLMRCANQARAALTGEKADD